MRAGQPERTDKAREWVAFAEDDLEFARAGLEMGRRAKPRLIAYLAQQSAEKYLKAFLIFHDVDFPFTHHIGRLLDLCATQGIWPARLEQTRVLTDFAIQPLPGRSASRHPA